MSEITNPGDQSPEEAAAAAAANARAAANPTGVQNPTLAPSEPYVPAPLPTPVAVTLPDEQKSARQIIDDALAQWGLGSLSGTAWDLISSGATTAEVLATIRKTPEYATRFAGNVQRSQAGYTPLSEADYLAREDAYRTQMQLGGLPKGFWDQPSDFADFIGKAVSVEEIAKRIDQGYTRIAQASPYTKQVFADYFGPASNSALAAFFLDETGERSLPVLERMATEAEIGGAAARFGIASDLATSQRLAALGISGAQAAQGYQQISDLASTFTATISEPQDISASTTGVAAVLEGNTAATEAIRRRQAARQAAFDQTGKALTTNQGVLGLSTLTP